MDACIKPAVDLPPDDGCDSCAELNLPTTEGTYSLTVTLSGGKLTYSWEEAPAGGTLRIFLEDDPEYVSPFISEYTYNDLSQLIENGTTIYYLSKADTADVMEVNMAIAYGRNPINGDYEVWFVANGTNIGSFASTTPDGRLMMR